MLKGNVCSALFVNTKGNDNFPLWVFWFLYLVKGNPDYWGQREEVGKSFILVKVKEKKEIGEN